MHGSENTHSIKIDFVSVVAEGESMARAIILDMDGLLLDTERIALRAFQHAAASLGFEMRQEDYARMIGLRSEDIAEVLRAIYGPDVPAEEMFLRSDARYAELIETEPVPLRPGVMELFDFLDRHEWLRAVATSTHTERARFKLGKAGILARVPRVVGGETVERGKPFPDIYLKAAEPFGVPPSEIVVLEDSFAGVRGAAAAGMRPVMIPDMLAPRDEERRLAAAVFDCLGEFARAAEGGRI